jgi:hypothetical protein
LSTLLIRAAHRKLRHAGVTAVMSHLRDRYLLLRAVQSYILCRRLSASMGSQVTAPIPPFRSAEKACFQHVGIDFFGPLQTREKGANSSHKVQVALFVCGSTRAIHLELLHDLTTTSFLLALRRFFGRRGLPASTNTDNGATLHKARKSLGALFDSLSPELNQYFAHHRIKWVHNAPLSSWWGGNFERYVGTCKAALRRSLGRALCTFEELQTLLVEIEGIINSRPLTEVSQDPQEPTCLTPAHFYLGAKLTNLPSSDVLDANDIPISTTQSLKIRWVNRQQLLDSFWTRWLWKTCFVCATFIRPNQLNIPACLPRGSLS